MRLKTGCETSDILNWRAVNRLFLAAFLALTGCSTSPSSSSENAPALPVNPTSTEARQLTRQLTWSVAGSYAHDTAAFTEGLLWKDGFLFESTGLERQSDVRKVDPASGQVLARWKLPPQFFGEGLAVLGGKFYNLTWQTKTGFVLDESFKPLARFRFQNEGWGLTTDGQKLLQSDGTDVLTWRDPKNFASLGVIKVTRNGQALRNLNELEWIRGYVWANVWQTDEIVVIDPKGGKVVAQLDLSGILPAAVRTGREDVLNGIAFDAQSGRIFVTGKNWPRVFSIQAEAMPTR